jgi:hypothetical protein
MYFNLITTIALICLIFSCSKSRNCPDTEDLGVLDISAESMAYLPTSLFEETDSLEFKSTDGRTTKFYLHEFSSFDSGPYDYIMPCEYDVTASIHTSFSMTSTKIEYLSTDSLLLRLNTRLRGQYLGSYSFREGYADNLNIWLSKEGGTLTVYGQMNITTDMRTLDEETIIESNLTNVYYDSIIIGGQTFTEVYGDRLYENRMSDVYWKKNQGLLGYKDKDGVEWILQQ